MSVTALLAPSSSFFLFFFNFHLDSIGFTERERNLANRQLQFVNRILLQEGVSASKSETRSSVLNLHQSK